MSPIRSAIALAFATSASGSAFAAPPAVAAAQDELLVVARTVMPRVAYHALPATENPVRVQATVFPGRIFHGVVDGIVGRLAGDDELTERAPLVAEGPAAAFDPVRAGPFAHGPGAVTTPSGAGGRTAGGAIGGAVLRATSGLGTRVGDAVQRAANAGAGP